MSGRVCGAGAPTRCKGNMVQPLGQPPPGSFACPGPAPPRAARAEAYLSPGYLHRAAAALDSQASLIPAPISPSLPPRSRARCGPGTPPMGPGRGDGPLRGRTARGGPVRAPPLDPGLPARRPPLPGRGACPAGPRRTDTGGGAAGRAGSRGRLAGRPGPCAWVAVQSPPRGVGSPAPPTRRRRAAPSRLAGTHRPAQAARPPAARPHGPGAAAAAAPGRRPPCRGRARPQPARPGLPCPARLPAGSARPPPPARLPASPGPAQPRLIPRLPPQQRPTGTPWGGAGPDPCTGGQAGAGAVEWRRAGNE